MKKFFFLFVLYLLLNTNVWCQIKSGIASWYGHPYHGRITANGEIFDTYNRLTAAINEKFRKKYLNKMVRIYTKIPKSKELLSVDVWINDILPSYHNRLIDLSYLAMNRLSGVSDGIIFVKIKILESVRVPCFPQLNEY